MRKTSSRLAAATLLFLLSAFLPVVAQVQTAAPAAGVVKQMGAVHSINGSALALVTDQGAKLAVSVQSGARIFRFAPGQSDPKTATPMQLGDVQVGDRVLVRGKMSADNTTLEATAVAVMKQQDIAHAQQQELLDWQRRSMGGVVKQVDAAAGSITLTVAGKAVTVTTSSKTTYKRYAPDSVRWDDATAAKLADIHPGDQLRAKGNKNEDGSELAAEQIVAGTFRNIAGLLTAVDAEQMTVTVQDLASKKAVSVKITVDSQMKVLPQQLAQGLAMRMKGQAGGSAAGGSASGSAAPPAQTAPAASGAAPSAQAGSQAGGHARNGDLNQLVARLPAATLADLKKGDAVMILSTEGSATVSPTAITLLGGVEPLLTASPSGTGAQSFLTPWSLASSPGGDQ